MNKVRWILAVPFILVGELCFEAASWLIGCSGTQVIDRWMNQE